MNKRSGKEDLVLEELEEKMGSMATTTKGCEHSVTAHCKDWDPEEEGVPEIVQEKDDTNAFSLKSEFGTLV